METSVHLIAHIEVSVCAFHVELLGSIACAHDFFRIITADFKSCLFFVLSGFPCLKT